VKEHWKTTLRMVPMTLVMGTIFWLSHQPGDSFNLPRLPEIDKLCHMVVYSVLAVTVLFAFGRQRRNRRPRLVVLLTVLFCLFYGISDEFHQSFVPGRSVSALDVLADCLGALLTGLLWLRWRKRRTSAWCLPD